MTLYVSKYGGYHFNISSGTRKLQPMPDGTYSWEEVLPSLTAEFRPKTLPHAARLQAQQHFDPLDTNTIGDKPGPYRQAGVASDPDFANVVYDASDYWMGYTAFDTDTDLPRGTGIPDDELKKLYEDALDEAAALGHTFIRIEHVKLAPPWPAYPRIKTARGVTTERVVERICERVREDGYDPGLVAAYERENENRDYVLAALAQLARDEALRAAEDEALTA